MPGVLKVRTIIARIMFGGLFALLLLPFRHSANGVLTARAENAVLPAKLTVEDAPLDRTLKAPISFAPVVQKVAPSVVNIYSTTVIRERPSDNPLLKDPFLRRFFGEQSPPGRPEPPREHKAQSLGSGVIVSPDGYIFTANHVVEGAQSVKVALASGETEYVAKIVGTDPPSDLAILKIDIGKPLPAVAIADSDKLEVGDLVLAVGDPFGVGQTVTMGIISGLGRGGLGITGYEDFIQTDAAINPGNSGGALVDAEGRLVGINTAILSRTGGFQGVGFAIPANMARFVMDRITRFGKVTRGYLGIYIQALNFELAKAFNLPAETSGALVGGVTPNSPAAKAGVEDGDVILAFNGKKVVDSRNLQLQVAQTAPGTRATLKLMRGAPGQRPAEKTVTATLAEMPVEKTLSQTNPRDERVPSNEDLLDGVEVTDIDAATRSQFEIPKNVQGALVVHVEPGSSAADAGLEPGNVIVDINRHAIRSAEEAVRLGAKSNGRTLLRVWSKGAGEAGGTHYLVIEDAKKASK